MNRPFSSDVLSQPSARLDGAPVSKIPQRASERRRGSSNRDLEVRYTGDPSDEGQVVDLEQESLEEQTERLGICPVCDFPAIPGEPFCCVEHRAEFYKRFLEAC